LKKAKQPNVLDLFCGAGGLSLGFSKAGYNIVAGIDSNKQFLETYKNNFRNANAILADLSDPSILKQPEIKGLLKNKIDVLIGGPPCQGFSIAGKRLVDDPRNILYKIYISFIEKINPTAILMENVPTLKSLYGGRIYNDIINEFEQHNYIVKDFTLNAADYGVPQSRKRIFFVALRKPYRFKIPAPTTIFNQITNEMAISDLPLLNNTPGDDVSDYIGEPKNDYQIMIRDGSPELFNHWRVEHKTRTIEIIKQVPDGGNYKNLPEHLQKTRNVNIAWTRMNSKKPCFTIDAGHNHHFHYEANRVPTVRESARIQSFPDTFRFFGNKTNQFKQVGNAVPPILAEKLALNIKEAINDL